MTRCRRSADWATWKTPPKLRHREKCDPSSVVFRAFLRQGEAEMRQTSIEPGQGVSQAAPPHLHVRSTRAVRWPALCGGDEPEAEFTENSFVAFMERSKARSAVGQLALNLGSVRDMRPRVRQHRSQHAVD